MPTNDGTQDSDMTDTDDGLHRAMHTHRPEEVEVRQGDAVESEEDMMEIRLPIASTGDVRNEGDDPLTDQELRGMARQIDSLSRGVFPEHGMSTQIDAETYSQFEKLGYWAAGDIEQRASADDEDLLMATARMPDPETLPAATGDYREALAILKEQAIRGIPIAASIGWRDEPDAPGGVDLMEASIVGIGADPRTNTEGGEQLVARAAVQAGADPTELVERVADVVADVRDGDGEVRPFGPPNGPADLWEDFEACVADVENWEGVDDPEAFCAWAEEQASDADDPEDTHDMTEDDTPDEGTTDTDDEQTADGSEAVTRADMDEMQARLDEMREDLRENTEMTREIREKMTGDGDDDEMDEDEEEEDTDGEQYADADDADADTAPPADEQAAAPDSERGADADSEVSERIAELEAELEDLRSGETAIEDPTPDADDADEQRDTTDDDTDPATAPDWASEV